MIFRLSQKLATKLKESNLPSLPPDENRMGESASDAYQRTLKRLGIECSMSRRGCCDDNAVMERFFWSLKHEWTNRERFVNLEEARLSLFRYLDTFYNPVRLHKTLHYLSLDQYEAENAPAVVA